MMFLSILMVVLVVTVQLSNQRPSLGNQHRLIQGRYRRNSDDISTAAPLSEEEFQLSLDQPIEINENDPINQGISLTGLVEGDIAGIEVDSDDGIKSYNYVNSAEALWPGGIVPYVISDIFNREDRKIIARGMRNIQDKSCVEFVPRTTEPDYVAITNGKGCFSQIGRTRGRQDVSLQRNMCMDVGTVIHEMMHALGFEHEHNRPDRDKFININEDNLKEGALKLHFQKYDSLRYTTLTEYDINSIMHYKAFAWAKNQSFPSIRSKKDRPSKPVPVGSTTSLLSKTDQEKLNKLYNCERSLSKSGECPVTHLGSKNNICSTISSKFGCYCIVKEKKTREDADKFCRDHQMQLVWLETKIESNEVAKWAFENDVYEFWSSGVNKELLTDQNKWHWDQYVSSASFLIKEFNWCKDEPDSYDDDEFYIIVKTIEIGKSCWQDAPGRIKKWAVCKPPVSTKVLFDNMKKLHSQLTVAFNEIQELEKKNTVAFNQILYLERVNDETQVQLKEIRERLLTIASPKSCDETKNE